MTIVRHLEEGDRARVAHLQQQAFILPPERIAIAGNYALEEGWVVEDEGVVQGALRVQMLGQFFGGRSVACAAVSSVKVAAEARGGGYGGALLRDVLGHLRDDGAAISTLFPVHAGVYRRYGWEVAVACQRRGLSLGELSVGSLGDADSIQVTPLGDDELPEVAAFYRSMAASANGLLDRDDDWWEERVLAPRYGREPYRYVARSGDEVRGYLLYTHEPAGANLPYGFDLDCRDFYWADPAAAAALLSFVRSHAGMGQRLLWIGPPADPIEHILRGLGPTLEQRLIGMCRLVNVTAAIEARGYPPDLETSFALRVEDDVLEANTGGVRVDIGQGAAQVSDTETDAPTVNVRTLAAIYTGWLDPATAVSAGLLEDADAAIVQKLRSAFGGPMPWMAEFF